MRKHRYKVVGAIIVAVILAISFFAGGNFSAPKKTEDASLTKTEATPTPEVIKTPEPTKAPVPEEKTQEPEKEKADITQAPQSEEPQSPVLSCTISVRCDTILNNLSRLKPEKKELIPENGVILETRTANFFEGETVFDLLTRELKNNKIHIEFNKTINGSAYIEGINNIYEFDCGDLSGWQYKVNGETPNVGCSDYILKHGDVVEWVYTCDFGNDI